MFRAKVLRDLRRKMVDFRKTAPSFGNPFGIAGLARIVEGTLDRMDSGNKAGQVFAFFNEVAIIDQLGTTLLGKVLPDGVHPSHFAIVVHLARAGNGKTPGALASAMQVTKATMSHSLKVLEGHGFIEIRPNGTDARSKNVFLTDSGRAFQGEAISAAARTFSQFLRESHIDTISDLLPGLAAIRTLLDQNRNPGIK